jgi:hypothetical protein
VSAPARGDKEAVFSSSEDRIRDGGTAAAIIGPSVVRREAGAGLRGLGTRRAGESFFSSPFPSHGRICGLRLLTTFPLPAQPVLRPSSPPTATDVRFAEKPSHRSTRCLRTMGPTDARSAAAGTGRWSGPSPAPATAVRSSASPIRSGAKIGALSSPGREPRKSLAAKSFWWMMSIRLGRRFQNAPGYCLEMELRQWGSEPWRACSNQHLSTRKPTRLEGFR